MKMKVTGKYVLILSGTVIFTVLFYAQLSMLLNPHGQLTKELLIGVGQDWRDDTHFRAALAFAWADWLVLVPLFIAGTIGVIRSKGWGYLLWMCAGIVSMYVSVFLWVLEKKYVYPVYGPVAYYTYYWGFFVYWGVGVIVYAIFQFKKKE